MTEPSRVEREARSSRVQAMVTLAQTHPGAPELHRDIAAEITELRAVRDEAMRGALNYSLLLGYAEAAIARVEALLVSDDEYRIKSVPAHAIRAALKNPDPACCVHCDHGALEHATGDHTSEASRYRGCRICECPQYERAP